LSWAEKGAVVPLLEKPLGVPDFRLAIGDDVTDEDLFARLPLTAWTVRVGAGDSGARFRLPGPRAVTAFLDRLGRLPAPEASHEGALASARRPGVVPRHGLNGFEFKS
jgi:trehalose-6-phosphatase